MRIKCGGKEFEAARIFCIGRNYRDHIKELSDPTPESPVIFCKSPLCLVPAGADVPYPPHSKDFHHEVELVVLIGKEGRAANDTAAESFIAGIGLGLDLTARDIQGELIKKGLPWDICKNFEASAPLGEIVPPPRGKRFEELEFSCSVNGKTRQKGTVSDMIFPVPALIAAISKVWTLRPGDLIYTGTPSGVGPLVRGDVIEVSGNFCGGSRWRIV